MDESVAAAIVRHEHVVVTSEQAGLSPTIAPDELFKQLHLKQIDLLTSDRDLVQFRIDHPTRFDRAMVFLQLTGGAVEQDDAIDRLFARYKAPKPGQLYSVTETRVKVRQLP